MATVAVIVGAAIINAIAFTAGNALYDKFGREDGSGERIRHNLEFSCRRLTKGK